MLGSLHKRPKRRQREVIEEVYRMKHHSRVDWTSIAADLENESVDVGPAHVDNGIAAALAIVDAVEDFGWGAYSLWFFRCPKNKKRNPERLPRNRSPPNPYEL